MRNKYYTTFLLVTLITLISPFHTKGQSCGTASFYAEDINPPFNTIPLSPHFCDDDLVVFWADNDATAGGFITPSLIFVITTDAFGDLDNEFYIYENGSQIYYEDLAASTVLTVTGQYLNPGSNYTIDLCEAFTDGGVSYEVYDGVCGTLLGSGDFPVGVSGCIEFGPWSPGGAGSYTGPGIVASFENGSGVWDPLEAGPGTHDITYCFDYLGCCNTCVTEQITVVNPYSADWTNSGPFCLDDAPVDLNDFLDSGSDAGGTWSGDGVSGSTFNPSDAGVGSHIISYLVGFDPDNYASCADEVTLTVIVEANEDATFSYDNAIYCLDSSNPTPTVSGVGGGTFSATPSGLVIDASSGEINLASSDEGTYTVTYTTSGNCQGEATFELTITDAADATFSYPNTTYCDTDENPIPDVIATLGGTFSADGGLAINATTGEIDLSSITTGGSYEITYTTSGDCEDSSTFQLNIEETPNPDFSYPSLAFCLDDSNPTPDIIGDSGGEFSGNNGLVIDPTTGEIDLAGSGIGTFEVTYQFSGNCPASSTVEIEIVADANAEFSYESSSYCQGNDNPFPVFSGGGTVGEFSSTSGGLIIDANTGEIGPCKFYSGNLRSY
jgi:hypothetical protein